MAVISEVLSGNRKKNKPTIMHPETLTIRSESITVFVCLLMLNEAMNSGRHLPTFIPSIIGMADEKLSKPVVETV